MKLIELTMSGFGPYADTETIDFTQLGDGGIYLITGDTGAGKTTIFDAISYALYGKTSAQQGNDARDEKTLRSDYASLNKETYVELKFEHQGSIYQIKRNPAYLRKARRGNGITRQNTNVILYKDDEEPIEKSKNVESVIQDEILHVNHNQFKQIAMIAQGEFRNLLTADKATRTAILQNIFMTQAYAKMEEIMKDKRDKAKKNFEQYEQTLLQCVKNLVLDDTSPNGDDLSFHQQTDPLYEIDEMIKMMNQLVDRNKKQFEQSETDVKKEEKRIQALQQEIILAKENNEKINQVSKLQNQKEQLHEKADDMHTRKEIYQKQEVVTTFIQPVYRTYQKAIRDNRNIENEIDICAKQIEQTIQTYTDLQKAFKKSKEKEPEIKEKSDQALRMKDKEGFYEKKEHLNQMLEPLNRKIRQLESEQKKNEETLVISSDQENILVNRIEANENVSARLEQNNAKEKQWQTYKEDADQLSTTRLTRLHTQKQVLMKAREAVQKSEQDYQRKKQAYDKAAHVFRLNQAGILAAELEEGCPCPVCGALHHPDKAVMVDAKYTEDIVNQLKDEQETIKDTLDQYVWDAKQNKVIYEESEKRWIADVQKTILQTEYQITNPAIDPWLQALRVWQKQVQETLQTIKEEKIQLQIQQDQYQTDKKQLEVVRDVIQATRSNQEAISKQLQDFHKEENQLEGRLQALPSLEYKSLYEAKMKRIQLENEADTIKKDIQRKQAALDRILQQQTALKSKRNTLNDRYIKTKKEVKIAGRDLDDILRKYGFTNYNECMNYVVDESILKSSKDILETYEKEVQDIHSKLKYATEQTKQLKYKDIEALTHALKEREENAKEVKNVRDRCQEKFRNNQRWTHAFTKEANQMDDIRRQRDRTNKLYTLLRGTISGNDRISLENYVQITGFKGIIEAANRRLGPMSEGQYQLYLHEESETINQNIFELDILDHWTGKKRPVRTLSGGESFKASLSLALGLSDFVTSSSGGIQINTLFIDEGFGTLDQRSLNDAMQVLMQLSEKGKLVGIISHREELKEQIPRQIVVTKKRDGSHIQIKSDD